MNRKAKLSLVGCGPGALDLITLRGVEAIKQADVLLYDALIHPDLLLYNHGAIKCYVGKRGGKPSCSQHDIMGYIDRYTAQGLHVCRLKGGDVSVFARAAEEVLWAHKLGIDVEMIPGISSYTAIAAEHQLPLTHRGISDSFWAVTGHTAEGLLSKDMELAARSNATVMVYMGMGHLTEIISLFLKHQSPELPVAIIQNGTLPEEKCVLGQLSTIEGLVEEQGISSPALIVIGWAAAKAMAKNSPLNIHQTENIAWVA